MSTYRNSRRDVAVADDYIASRMDCRGCHASTDRAELALHGGQCVGCYRAYCEQGRHYPALSIPQRKAALDRVRVALAGGLRASPRQHIDHLAELERTGQATPGQRGFLAAAGRVSQREAAEQAPQPQPQPAQTALAEPLGEPPAWTTEA